MPTNSHHTKLNGQAVWAMAVGGMIGGGAFTLGGILLSTAGPLAWLSLALGSFIALLTSRSCAAVAAGAHADTGVLGRFLSRSRSGWAGLVAWWVPIVYALAIAVYAFTFAQYLGRALQVSRPTLAVLTVGVIGALAVLNLLGVKEPVNVQIAAVWFELIILVGLAAVGFSRGSAANVGTGVPPGSVTGVISGTAATFIAFEGFEMLAYDLRELHRPSRALTRAVPAAIVTVAVAYALAISGAAFLVGGGELVAHSEAALALAGERAAGSGGRAALTIAACASAISAINATLFSVARLTRSAAEQRLLPEPLARVSSRESPTWSIVLLAVGASAIGASSSLEALVQTASLAFLLVFTLINVLALRANRARRVSASAGAVLSGLGALVVGRTLALSHPGLILGLMLLLLASALALVMPKKLGRRRFA